MTWDKFDDWIRVFSKDKLWEGIEKSLITARRLGGNDDKIMPLLYECAVEPYFLGFADNLLHLGFLAELLGQYGWELVEELMCNLSAKILGRGRGAPQGLHLEGIRLFESILPLINELADNPPAESDDFDEDALAAGLVSGDLTKTFEPISRALKAGVTTDRVASTMVLLAADRMARTPVNLNPGWGSLTWEMTLASSLRIARRYGGFKVAARALYHVAWQFFGNRWLNITTGPLSQPLENDTLDAANEDEAVETILEAMDSIKVREIGRITRGYLNSGFSGDGLLHAMGLNILKDDTA